MIRILTVCIVLSFMIGCSTSPTRPAKDDSPPHTAADISRKYSASLEKVIEACKMAIDDIGEDYLTPKIKIMDSGATITAASRTRMYGIVLSKNDGSTEVMLFLEDKASKEVIRKSVFDEFWAAVEKHL